MCSLVSPWQKDPSLEMPPDSRFVTLAYAWFAWNSPEIPVQILQHLFLFPERS